MSKKLFKYGTLCAVSLTMLGTVAPSLTVFADEVVVNYSSRKNELYNQLPADKKIQFNELVNALSLTEDKQLELLQQYKQEHPRRVRRGVKSAVIKKVARFLAGKLGQKSLVEVTNYLFEWQDNLEAGAENYLVKHGWNRTTAHWTVKTASFIFL